MKKNINYIMFFALLFFMNLYVVNAKVFEIKNGESTADLSEYYSCKKPNSNIGTTSDYISRSEIDGEIFAFIKKVPTKEVSIRYNCFKMVDGKKVEEDVTVKADSTAKLYEYYNEVEESDTTYDLKIHKTYTSFSSCKARVEDGADPGAIDYIKIKNGENGVEISVARVPSKTVTAYLTCTTQDGRTTVLNIRLSEKSSVYHEGTEAEDSDNKEVSGNCNSIFGSVDEDGSNKPNGLPDVAYVLNKIFNFMQFLGPILMIIVTIFDLVKTVASSDKDALSKLLKTSSKRLIYAVLLFVFPSILKLILSWVSNDPTSCGIH